MKVALIFTGISYGHGRDFNHCFPNIQETLISPLLEKHEVSIFLCTYENEKKKDLIELYHPVAYKTIPFIDSHQVGTYIQSMENIKNKDFDFVFSTRFDIHFNKRIDQININFKKFNVLFPEKGWYNKLKWWPIWRKIKYLHRVKLPYIARYTTDNFFAFPYAMLDEFILVLKEELMYPTRKGLMDMHGVFNKLRNRVGEERVNIVSQEPEVSDVNSFYFLCRKR